MTRTGTIASDPLPLAVGGAALALVLLALSALLGSMVGRDHVITHISGRVIPAVFHVLAYPVLIACGVGLVNSAAIALGQAAVGGGIADGLKNALVLALPSPLLPTYILLWLVLIYYAVRLTIRLAYSLFRFLVALVFGPVANML